MMLRIAQGFHDRGLRVAVVAPEGPGVRSIDARVPYNVVRYLPMPRPLELLSIAFSTIVARQRGDKAMSIASAWWPAGLAICLLPPALRGPLMIVAHGTEIAPRRRGVRRMLMRFTFNQAAVIVANSQYTAALLAAAGIGKRIFVVPLGVTATRIKPRRAENPTILSVGRLVPRKGFDRVLRSLPTLISHFPTLKYEIVGDGPQRQELENLAHELKIDSHVIFFGRVTDEEINCAYARAWLFALPARNIDDDVEGFGLVYLEAAMGELPTVGGRDSGASDAIDDGVTGLIVDGEDSEAVCDALLKLLCDRETADEMGRRGQVRAETMFTWENTIDRFIELL